MEVEGEVEKENDSDHNKQEKHESIQEAPENIKNDNQSVSESHNKPKNNGQYSPVVFKLASENGINLENIEGTGNLGRRSEEHTSELQSRFDLVCRLLLEKKKTTKIHDNI